MKWRIARFFATWAALVLTSTAAPASAASSGEVLVSWYRMALNLTRHTATMSPPVASRAYGYLGVAAFEVVASEDTGRLASLAGQLNGFGAGPARDASLTYSTSIALNAAMGTIVGDIFSHTGPTGHRAMDALLLRLGTATSEGIDQAVAERSEAYGRALADHILAWASTDGGAVIENMGFPFNYANPEGPGLWVPTSTIVQQQAPLLPSWGDNRPFAMPSVGECPTDEPPAYSEDPASDYFRQAKEVYDTWTNLQPEQRAIARFWSDDAMLSVTPPGHWLSIALDLIEIEGYDLERSVDVLARLGIGMADAFIGCWHSKFTYNAVRPITFIRRAIDEKFETVLNTPPFSEFPSGHSTQSSVAAAVLTAVMGDDLGFLDDTGQADGLTPRWFPSFQAAADEAGISRLYGGIHFRAAIELGAAQGRCIAAYAIALTTWR